LEVTARTLAEARRATRKQATCRKCAHRLTTSRGEWCLAPLPHWLGWNNCPTNEIKPKHLDHVQDCDSFEERESDNAE
jgi:hypothetical protein